MSIVCKHNHHIPDFMISMLNDPSFHGLLAAWTLADTVSGTEEASNFAGSLLSAQIEMPPSITTVWPVIIPPAKPK